MINFKTWLVAVGVVVAASLTPTVAQAQCVFCDFHARLCKSAGYGSGSLTCYIDWQGFCYEQGNCQIPEGFAARPELVETYATRGPVTMDRAFMWNLRNCRGDIVGRLFSQAGLKGRLGDYRKIEVGLRHDRARQQVPQPR